MTACYINKDTFAIRKLKCYDCGWEEKFGKCGEVSDFCGCCQCSNCCGYGCCIAAALICITCGCILWFTIYKRFKNYEVELKSELDDGDVDGKDTKLIVATNS